MGNLLGPALVQGNRVSTLLNGAQVFPAMLTAIRSARRTITFETYIYWSGLVGQQFADALSERARAGVRAHVLIDWVGAARMDPGLIEQMRRAGVEVKHYRPLRWYTLDRLNNRTHRKLLVVDGRLGSRPPSWTTGWKPRAGCWTGPTTFRPSAGADRRSRSIRIANAYFVPDSLVVAMLVDARRRGVEVEIIVPGPILDAQIVRRASRRLWGPLLEAGVRIYEYQPTMYHTKVMVVDDLWVSVGSTNFDAGLLRSQL